jgi:hypothetical protein
VFAEYERESVGELLRIGGADAEDSNSEVFGVDGPIREAVAVHGRNAF